MSLLDRAALLAKENLKIEKVEFPDGSYVCVRMMTGRERDRFEKSLMEEKVDKDGIITYKQTMEDFRAKLAVNVLCDDNGVNLLKFDDYRMLSTNMSAARLIKIVDAAQKLNAIDEKTKENLVKNSEAAQIEEEFSGFGAASTVVATVIPIDGSKV